MEKSHFISQMEKLKQVFGERNYPEERIALFWQKFHLVDPDEFSDGISALIMEFRVAPLLAEFSAKFKVRSERIEKIEKIKATQKSCALCGNTGIVTDAFSKIINGFEYWFSQRCSCQLGDPGLCLPADVRRHNGSR